MDGLRSSFERFGSRLAANLHELALKSEIGSEELQKADRAGAGVGVLVGRTSGKLWARI